MFFYAFTSAGPEGDVETPLGLADNNVQKHEGVVCFENAYFRAKTYVILTSLKYVTECSNENLFSNIML